MQEPVRLLGWSLPRLLELSLKRLLGNEPAKADVEPERLLGTEPGKADVAFATFLHS